MSPSSASDGAPDAAPSRDELLLLLQRHVMEATRLGRVFAERHGLHYTDWQALVAVRHAERLGAPLTPGDLGEHLVLSSGATTAVLDRLQRAAYLERVRDVRDRRRLTLHLAPGGAALLAQFYAAIEQAADDVLAGYDGAQRVVAARFLTDAVTQLVAYRRRLVQR